MQGTILGIFVATEKGDPMLPLEGVNALSGLGLVGDRYCNQQGTIKKGIKHVTLIESEAIEAANKDYKIAFEARETRRNLLTQGIALNHLVGRDFFVGNVKMRGVELSEPCGYLERLTGKKIKDSLVHRGGIRAEILTNGTIAIGDKVSVP